MNRYNLITLVKATLKKATIIFKEKLILFKSAPLKYIKSITSYILTYISIFSSVGKVAKILKFFKYCYWLFLLISGVCYFVFDYQITEILSVVQIYCFALIGRLDSIIRTITDTLKDILGGSKVMDKPDWSKLNEKIKEFKKIPGILDETDIKPVESKKPTWSYDRLKEEYVKAHTPAKPKSLYSSCYDFLTNHKYEIIAGIVIISGITFVVYNHGDPEQMVKAITGTSTAFGSWISGKTTDIYNWIKGSGSFTPDDKPNTLRSKVKTPELSGDVGVISTFYNPALDTISSRLGRSLSDEEKIELMTVFMNYITSGRLSKFSIEGVAEFMDSLKNDNTLIDFSKPLPEFIVGDSKGNIITQPLSPEIKQWDELSRIRAVSPISTDTTLPPLQGLGLQNSPTTPKNTISEIPSNNPLHTSWNTLVCDNSPKMPGAYEISPKPSLMRTDSQETITPNNFYVVNENILTSRVNNVCNIIETYTFSGSNFVYSDESLKQFFKNYATFIIEKHLRFNKNYSDCFDIQDFLCDKSVLDFEISDETVEFLTKKEKYLLRYENISTEDRLGVILKDLTITLSIRK